MEATTDSGSGKSVLLTPKQHTQAIWLLLTNYLSSLDLPPPLNSNKLYGKAMSTATTVKEDKLVQNILQLLARGTPKTAPDPTKSAWGNNSMPISVSQPKSTVLSFPHLLDQQQWQHQHKGSFF